MDLIDRRNFLRAGLAASGSLLAAGGGLNLFANPYGLPVGLQLYTVRQQLQANFAGTLRKVASIGYKEVEFAYHNHNVDFEKFNGVVAFDVLLQHTDPAFVDFEMDCFWVTRAGYDPVAYLEKYPGRFPLLHIKDERRHYPPTTTGPTPRAAFAPVGRGIIDWKRIFEAAHKSGLKHYFVGQDQCELPPFEAIQISYNYLHKLTV